MRPIVRPGASAALRSVGVPSPVMAIGVIVVAVLVALVAGVVGMATSGLGAFAVIAGAFAAAAFLLRRYQRDVVSGPSWRVDGKRIDGQGFQLLADIDSRFAYAEENIKKLPTGIVWSDVDADVRALLWEAAEQGASITALDQEIHELRYADPGTPQAALKHSLEDRRKAHWELMRGIQWEAETLARTAGNAAAAAHVALLRTGSLAALEQITPSRRAIVAAGALAEARSHLELLADVWAQLDESGTLAAEKIDNERRQLGEGS